MVCNIPLDGCNKLNRRGYYGKCAKYIDHPSVSRMVNYAIKSIDYPNQLDFRSYLKATPFLVLLARKRTTSWLEKSQLSVPQAFRAGLSLEL